MASNPRSRDVADIQLFDVETLKDPWDAYARLRDHAPVFYVPGFDIHVVTRYDLVREVIRLLISVPGIQSGYSLIPLSSICADSSISTRKSG